jgi:exoribonuclease R
MTASGSATKHHYAASCGKLKGSRHGRKFRLGDAVRVKVVRVNAFRSEIDFELVQTSKDILE